MKEKPLKQRFNNIRFKTWFTFIAMTLLTVILLWVFQVLFYNTFYRSMKDDQVQKVGKSLVDKYQNQPSYWNSLSDIARDNNVTIYIFRIKSGGTSKADSYEVKKALPTLISNEHMVEKLDTLDWSDSQFDEFFLHVQNGEQTFSYVSENESYLIYGNTIDDYGDKVYLYIASFMDPIKSTTNILSTQLIVVTIISVFASILLSYWFSRQITKPITDMSEQAQKLGDGNFDVKFNENDSYEEIKLLSRTLNYAVEEMEKTEQFRREFIANVSHDLRTPLTMVKAYAEMIRDISGKNDAKRTQHAQVIIDEAERLNSLVADIQNLSKLQAGTDAYEPEKFDLSGLCLRVINRFGVMTEKFGYIIKQEIQPGVTVFADSRKIEQVLYNLIGNAINYTGADKTVYLILTAKDGVAEVRIRDTGKGIAPDEIDSVWDRYYRANQVKRKIIGSGLGLSIVKNILVMHSAQYGIDSELNKGTDFWFRLKISSDEK